MHCCSDQSYAHRAVNGSTVDDLSLLGDLNPPRVRQLRCCFPDDGHERAPVLGGQRAGRLARADRGAFAPAREEPEDRLLGRHAHRSRFGFGRIRMSSAGTPPTTALSGTSFVTTA